MIASKRILLHVALLLTHVHLHAADSPKNKTEAHLLKILNICYQEPEEYTIPLQQQEIAELTKHAFNNLKQNGISGNELRILVKNLNNEQNKIREQIKDEPRGSEKERAALRNIQRCQQAKNSLFD